MATVPGMTAWPHPLARLLELADIALGLKKPELPKKRRAAATSDK